MKQQRREAWTRDEQLAALREFIDRHERVPRWIEFGRYGLPHGRTLQRTFGTTRAAIEAAGGEPRRPGRPSTIDLKEAA